jgi:hypothetical protein
MTLHAVGTGISIFSKACNICVARRIFRLVPGGTSVISPGIDVPEGGGRSVNDPVLSIGKSQG